MFGLMVVIYDYKLLFVKDIFIFVVGFVVIGVYFLFGIIEGFFFYFYVFMWLVYILYFCYFIL